MRREEIVSEVVSELADEGEFDSSDRLEGMRPHRLVFKSAQKLIRWGLFGPLFRHSPFDAWIANTVLSPPKPRTILYEGKPVTINCANAEILGFALKWKSSRREQDARAWLAEHLSDDHTFLNVGAHIGLFVLYAHAIRQSVRTVCVEASSPNLGQLLSNVRLNRLKSVDVIHCAAGSEDKLAKFGLQTTVPGNYNGRLILEHYAGDRPNVASEWVQIRTMDGLLADLDASPQIFVMDIDGHEVMALKGMANTLQNPALKMAIIETNAHTANDVLRIMSDAGFSNIESSPDDLGAVSNRLFIRD